MKGFLLVAASAALLAHAPFNPVIERDGSAQIALSTRPLAPGALEIQGANPQKMFATKQRVISAWAASGTIQFLAYRKYHPKQDTTVRWELVPYHNTNTLFGRIWQQFLVLWKISFGASPLANPQAELEKAQAVFKKLSSNGKTEVDEGAPASAAAGTDPFCQQEVIERQVVYEGRYVNILYNYAPIEPLHFLIVPKEHGDFSTLSQEAYVEATTLTNKLITHLSESPGIESVYLFHKTGADAGQTVMGHWHLQVIATTTCREDWFGKLTVFKNMLLGPSPMSSADLANQVAIYKAALENL